jgi:isochorismate hydrolase
MAVSPKCRPSIAEWTLPPNSDWRQPTKTTTNNADRAALLIIDPNSDFTSEGGKLYERTRETAKAAGFYENMRKLVSAIRAAA